MRNNSKAAAKRTQVVYSEPRRILVGTKTKLTKAGVEITINRYKNNPNAKPVRVILHPIVPRFNQFNDLKNR